MKSLLGFPVVVDPTAAPGTFALAKIPACVHRWPLAEPCAFCLIDDLKAAHAQQLERYERRRDSELTTAYEDGYNAAFEEFEHERLTLREIERDRAMALLQ